MICVGFVSCPSFFIRQSLFFLIGRSKRRSVYWASVFAIADFSNCLGVALCAYCVVAFATHRVVAIGSSSSFCCSDPIGWFFFLCIFTQRYVSSSRLHATSL